MIVFLTGCHGVGKSTLVNNLQVNKPIVKYSDVDLIPFTGTGFKQQMTRIDILNNIIDHLPANINVIVDRSPLDFYIYPQFMTDVNEYEKEILEWNIDQVCKKMEKISNVLNVLVHDSYEEIKLKIIKRGREEFNESDWKYTRKVWEIYADIYAEGWIDSYPVLPLLLKDAESYLISIFS